VSGGSGRREAFIRCDYVAPHRPLGGIARCPENVPGHARLTDQSLPLEVVPQRERGGQGELRELGARRVEAVVVPDPDPGQTEAWQERAQPAAEERRGLAFVGPRLPVGRPLVRGLVHRGLERYWPRAG